MNCIKANQVQRKHGSHNGDAGNDGKQINQGESAKMRKRAPV
jgi:hypothetical protein